MLTLTNIQVEADNLDCVTRSALLAQENQHLKERLETQIQQMLHVQEEVCGLRVPALLQSCSIPAFAAHSNVWSACLLHLADIATRLVFVLLYHYRAAQSNFLSVIPFVDAVKAEDNHH